MAFFDDPQSLCAHLQHVFSAGDSLSRIILQTHATNNDDLESSTVSQELDLSLERTFRKSYFQEPEKKEEAAVADSNDGLAEKKTAVKVVSVPASLPSHDMGLQKHNPQPWVDPAADRPSRPRPPAQPASQSALSKLLANSSVQNHNPFSEYARFSGDAHRSRDVVRKNILFPFAEVVAGKSRALDVVILAKATVQQAIGYIMYKYTDENRTPKLKEDVDMYVLRMDDDGEPDTDLPPLDHRDVIAKFQFDNLWLCKGPNYRENDAEGQDLGFIRVVFGDGSNTTLKRDSQMTVADVLEQSLRKRAMRVNHDYLPSDYLLERECEAGRSLEPTAQISGVASAKAGGTLEFRLIKKFSKRWDKSSTEEQPKQPERNGVENSLNMHIPKAYFVYKHHKFGPKQQVELLVDTDKISINPYGKTSFMQAKQKQVQLNFDQVVDCEHVDEKKAIFRIVNFNLSANEARYHELEAQSPEEAAQIVSRIQNLAHSQVTDLHTNLLQAYERKKRSEK